MTSTRGRETSLTESKMNRMAFNAEDPEIDALRVMISSPVGVGSLESEQLLQHARDISQKAKDDLTDRLRREELEEDRSQARAKMAANLPGASDDTTNEQRGDSANEKVNQTMENAKEKVENAWETTKEKVEGLVDKAKEKLHSEKKSTQNGSGDTVSSKTEDLAGKAKRATEDVKNKAQKKGENIKEKIEQKSESIKERAEKEGEYIKEKMDQTKETIKEKASEAKENIEKKAEDIKEKIEAKSEKTMSKVGGLWHSAKEKVSNIWGMTVDKAGEIKDSVKGSTTIVGDDLAEHIKLTREAEQEEEKSRAREKLGATLVTKDGHHHAHPAVHFEPELGLKNPPTNNKHIHSSPVSPTKEVAFNAEDPEVDTVRSFFQSLHVRRSG